MGFIILCTRWRSTASQYRSTAGSTFFVVVLAITIRFSTCSYIRQTMTSWCIHLNTALAVVSYYSLCMYIWHIYNFVFPQNDNTIDKYELCYIFAIIIITSCIQRRHVGGWVLNGSIAWPERAMWSKIEVRVQRWFQIMFFLVRAPEPSKWSPPAPWWKVHQKSKIGVLPKNIICLGFDIEID